MSTTEDTTPTPRARRPVIGASVGLTLGSTALFLLLRMFAVAQWNWHTALDILGSMDFGNVVPIALGTVVAQPIVTGVIVVLLLPVALVELFWPSEANTRSTLWTAMLAAALLVVFVASAKTFQDWWLIAVMVLVAGILVVFRLSWRRGAARERLVRMLRRLGAIAGAAFLLMAALVPTPWVPLEAIVTHHDGVMRGYVLSVEPGFLQVLSADHRQVVAVTTSDVVSRTTLR